MVKILRYIALDFPASKPFYILFWVVTGIYLFIISWTLVMNLIEWILKRIPRLHYAHKVRRILKTVWSANPGHGGEIGTFLLENLFLLAIRNSFRAVMTCIRFSDSIFRFHAFRPKEIFLSS